VTQNWKTAYTAVTDFIAGHDSEAAFTKGFTDGGGKIIGAVRFPQTNPDFVPFVQRIKDAKPDLAFLWVPAQQQAIAMINAVRDLGLREAGIKSLRCRICCRTKACPIWETRRSA
jgi:branched-chain amino acid transport system substrate-binding protein